MKGYIVHKFFKNFVKFVNEFVFTHWSVFWCVLLIKVPGVGQKIVSKNAVAHI